MEELVIKISNLIKSFESKEILSIQNLSVYQGDRIGIIGPNGHGKSTLLKLIANQIEPDIGKIQVNTDISFYEQVSKNKINNFSENTDWEMLSHFDVPNNNLAQLSGGEFNKVRIVQALSRYSMGLLLDEPTTHLDKSSIDYLIEELNYFYGTLLFVSHDRYFLNKLAEKIWYVENGTVTEYKGNYDQFLIQRQNEKISQENSYEQYQQTKKKLESSISKGKNQAVKMDKVSDKQKNRHIKPSRLSATKQKDTIQKAANKKVKSIENRLSKLKNVEKPQTGNEIKFPKVDVLEIHNEYPIIGEKVDLWLGDKKILEEANFEFKRNSIIALTGENGSGKTTLLNYIFAKSKGIIISPKVVFSYYQQMSYEFMNHATLLNYLMSLTDYSESIVRSILFRLGFEGNDVTKQLSVLSGGEATRIAIAETFLKPSNVLLLDEPTNFIDLKTINALEELMKSYRGTIVFVSHDEEFISNVATDIYEISEKKLQKIK